MRYLILLCLAVPFHTFAETSLWKVTKGNSTLFIGGTIHVLSASDYPLPVEFSLAYKQSQRIVFETDMKAMEKPEVQQKLINRLMYPKNKSLNDYINDETYKVLSDYLLTKNMSIDMFKQYKPAMVVMTLLMIELQKLGMADTGVDKYFSELAVQDGKPLAMLETVEVQFNVLENLGKGMENEMILSTIAEIKELPLLMGEMKKAWRAGDMKTLELISAAPMRRDYPHLYQALLINRNNAWLPKVEKLLRTPEIELVLVGALHLVGREGVLSQLQSLGYKVEIFKPELENN